MRIVRIIESTLMHTPKFEHPENPNRVQKITTALSSAGFTMVDVSVEAVNFSEAHKIASRIHSKGYIDYLLKLSTQALSFIDEDTYITSNSLKLALATLYYSYEYTARKEPLFIVSRPPGHHVGKGGKTPGVSTQGFCLLNNAVAAVEGFRDQGFRKVMVLDFDAHHGNGTMEILYRDRVLQIDLHQDPDTLYPYRGYPEELGEGEGYGYKVNIILPPSTSDDLFIELLKVVTPIIENYSPEALVVSAGFDGFVNDGLADLKLTEKSYYEIGRFVRKLSIPVLMVLEGGYASGLEKGVVSFVEGLSGLEKKYEVKMITPPILYRRAVDLSRKLVDKVIRKIS